MRKNKGGLENSEKRPRRVIFHFYILSYEIGSRPKWVKRAVNGKIRVAMQSILEKIKKVHKNFVFKSILLWRKNKGRFFYISFKKGIPKIHVNEYYEKWIKWILRILTLVGIISSVFAFSQWYLNLLLAVCMLGIQQLLEKTIFIYYTFYLSAIPKYNSEDWKGMVWVHSESVSNNYFEVGMFFSTREAAQRIFPIIKHWSKEGDDDKNNLIQVSVVVNRDADDYHVYIYPNTELDPDYLATKAQRDKEQPQKEHVIKTISIMFCKGFNYASSSFPRFQKFYKDGDFYFLCAYVFEDNKPVKLSSLGAIRKNILKIKNQKELTRSDREYEHAKFIIDRDAYKKEPPPPPSRQYVVQRRSK